MKSSTVLIILFWSTCTFAQDTYYFIAHAGPGDPYWTIQAKGAQDAAKAVGVRLIFSAPDKPGDISKQVELLDAAISSQPSGIATTLPDARAFQKSLQRAKKRGIPVIAVNTREPKRDQVGLPYEAYVGMDELEAGKRVALRAQKDFGLKSGDSVVIANHQPGVMSLELRTKGMGEIFKGAGIKTQSLDIGSNPVQAISVLKSYLKANLKTQAIMALGPLGYTPAGKLLGEMKSERPIHLAAFDIDPVGLELIRKGILNFTLDAQPYMQAYLAVEELYLTSRFGITPIDLNTGVGFLDLSNVERLAKLIQGGYQ